MPNRIIRESCRTSPNLAILSHGAERFFWRLVTVADDFGRFEAEHDVLLCSCFPKLLDRVKLTHIKEWFAELVACQLVTTYVVNTRNYAFFNTWDHHQRTRAQHSKYPSPSSDNICCHVLSNVADLRPTTYENRPTTYDDGFDLFWSTYNYKVSKVPAEKAWKKLKPNEELQATILAAITAQQKTEKWTKDNGKFRKHPSTWLNAKGWEDEVSAPANDFFPFPFDDEVTP